MKKIILFAILVSIIACKHDNIENSTGTEIIDLANISDLSSQELQEKIGPYAGWYKSSNRLVRVHGNNKASLHSDEDKLRGLLYASYIGQISPPSGSVSNGGDYVIDDEITIRYDEEKGKYKTPLSTEEIDQFFDKIENEEISISNIQLSGNVITKKIKVSPAIKITNLLENRIGLTNVAYFERENFILNYNYDPNNLNGLLIKMSFRGVTLGMSLDDIQQQQETTSRIAFIRNESPDGKIRVPKELFQGLPEDALVTMWVHRNNGEIFKNKEDTYNYDVSFDYQFEVAVK